MIPTLIRFEPYLGPINKIRFAEVALIVVMTILAVVDIISLVRYIKHKTFLYWIQVTIFILNIVVILLVVILLLGYL